MSKRISLLCRCAAPLLAAVSGSSGVFAQEPQPTVELPRAPQPDPEIEEIVLIGRQKSTAFDVVSARINEDVISDFLGAESIARVGDSSVSAALRRVPGLTLVDDQFIYVRGLGERYSSVLLNGAEVPSPDLTRNVIPLDIFPTNIVSALAVQKSYSPDAPAAFGGGTVDIVTRGVPNGPLFSAKVGSGLNSDGAGGGYSYPGGGDDTLGKDDGTRAFPNALRAGLAHYAGNINPTNILARLNGDGQQHTIQQAEAVNRDLAVTLNRNIEIVKSPLSSDGGFELALGNRWAVGKSDSIELGVLGLVSYDNTWRNHVRVERNVADPLTLVENKLRTTNQVSATQVLNVGLKYLSDHEIRASRFLLRNTDDDSAIATRTNNNFQRADGRQLRDYNIRYEQREFVANQVRGHHVVGSDTRHAVGLFDRDFLDGVALDWYTSDATAETDIPNEVNVSAEDQIDPATGALLQTALRRANSAADFRFTFLRDDVRSGGWDLAKPLTFDKLTVLISGGQDVSQKGRSYTQNQFGLGTTALAAAPILVGTPGTVLTDANILNPAYDFTLSAGGIGTESYLSAQTTEAAYVKVDALVQQRWRFAGGFRWEQFRQASLPIDTLQYEVGRGQCALIPCDADALRRIVFFEDDVYPAFTVTRIMKNVWAEDFQLRFGLSKTVARPDLREVSGSSYIDPLTETRIRGNPNLLTAALTNFDARAEWFFGNGDSFTVSMFYKDIERPIETVRGAGTDDNISLTFVNARAANVSGIEVEWLKSWSSLAPRFLAPFFVSGNITLSDSELTVGDVGFNVTNDSRPLAQHSKYVANVQLGFDSADGAHSFTVAYNTFGKRLYFAGRDGVADAYEQPFESLDFIYSYYSKRRLQLKLKIQNLLDDKLEIKQAGAVVIEQSVGKTAKIDLQWAFGP